MARRQTRTKTPLSLATSGYLYVGGRIDRRIKGAPVVGQMYAEYFIPARLRSPYPIVMLHGGSQTGTNFTGTPDGRPALPGTIVADLAAGGLPAAVAILAALLDRERNGRGRVVDVSMQEGVAALLAPMLAST